MKESGFENNDTKQAAADVLFLYSKFAMACIGCKARPCDLRFHLMKEISGMPSSLNRESPQNAASPDAMGESSSTGTARLDRTDSFRAL
ncbi:hypothetical protein AAZX31_16G111800 [Glycine max]|uniref:Uncharacterized protein n=2 Tax=Glycine soja TaxID=3848 RepID=A0A0B2PAL4_GLYSO|nr:hypothetical protein JHK86_045304 [Glycine max]KAG4941217.1 hypothetical protein JHK87_045088 [Glycine soja]KAG4952018.1 hypothetical protein JHK85_045885 [Glycine max]KAG5099837.1 hypothetical protein JHK82_044889 [Glycine max]KAG5108447.1 hypothetical protein JHK84_045354 [Glycine max]